jgi:hypothetical protein
MEDSTKNFTGTIILVPAKDSGYTMQLQPNICLDDELNLWKMWYINGESVSRYRLEEHLKLMSTPEGALLHGK